LLVLKNASSVYAFEYDANVEAELLDREAVTKARQMDYWPNTEADPRRCFTLQLTLCDGSSSGLRCAREQLPQ
jgi:hypothetical protein